MRGQNAQAIESHARASYSALRLAVRAVKALALALRSCLNAALKSTWSFVQLREDSRLGGGGATTVCSSSDVETLLSRRVPATTFLTFFGGSDDPGEAARGRFCDERVTRWEDPSVGRARDGSDEARCGDIDPEAERYVEARLSSRDEDGETGEGGRGVSETAQQSQLCPRGLARSGRTGGTPEGLRVVETDGLLPSCDEAACKGGDVGRASLAADLVDAGADECLLRSESRASSRIRPGSDKLDDQGQDGQVATTRGLRHTHLEQFCSWLDLALEAHEYVNARLLGKVQGVLAGVRALGPRAPRPVCRPWGSDNPRSLESALERPEEHRRMTTAWERGTTWPTLGGRTS